MLLQDKCHPQTIAVCKTRADGLGLNVIVGNENDFDINKDTCGILLQYPATDGSIHDYKVLHCHQFMALTHVAHIQSCSMCCPDGKSILLGACKQANTSCISGSSSLPGAR